MVGRLQPQQVMLQVELESGHRYTVALALASSAKGQKMTPEAQHSEAQKLTLLATPHTGTPHRSSESLVCSEGGRRRGRGTKRSTRHPRAAPWSSCHNRSPSTPRRCRPCPRICRGYRPGGNTGPRTWCRPRFRQSCTDQTSAFDRPRDTRARPCRAPPSPTPPRWATACLPIRRRPRRRASSPVPPGGRPCPAGRSQL